MPVLLLLQLLVRLFKPPVLNHLHIRPVDRTILPQIQPIPSIIPPLKLIPNPPITLLINLTKSQKITKTLTNRFLTHHNPLIITVINANINDIPTKAIKFTFLTDPKIITPTFSILSHVHQSNQIISLIPNIALNGVVILDNLFITNSILYSSISINDIINSSII